MFEQFLFIGFPYIAVFTMVAGCIYRYRLQQFTYSALSSQFLESRQKAWSTQIKYQSKHL